MNDNEQIFKTIVTLLEKGVHVVLASIASLQGSSPRHLGTKMLIDATGKSHGTIGGSLLEAVAIKSSWAVLASAHSKLVSYELSGKDASASGMICGGKAELLLDYIPSSKENKELFRSCYTSILNSKDFYFMTQLSGSDEKLDITAHSILYRDGRITGNIVLSETDIANLKAELPKLSATSIIPLAESRIVVYPVSKVKTVYCFGAGHVAVPTAHIAELVGFRIVVIDDRLEFAKSDHFPQADKILIIENFEKAMEGLEIDADSFLVILTRGHQFDREVLEQALKTNAGYIGMISSRRKKETIFNALMEKGITREELDRVHSPIGVPIETETPEEIAVSIVAELIDERSKLKK
jgi:xanthine dehydrogenase accessory factor